MARFILWTAAFAWLLTAAPPVAALGAGDVAVIVQGAPSARYMDGCATLTQGSGPTYELYCYYQPDNKVCVGPDEVFHGCSPVPGAAQSAVACVFWLEADAVDYVLDQVGEPSVVAPPVPAECV